MKGVFRAWVGAMPSGRAANVFDYLFGGLFWAIEAFDLIVVPSSLRRDQNPPYITSSYLCHWYGQGTLMEFEIAGLTRKVEAKSMRCR